MSLMNQKQKVVLNTVISFLIGYFVIFKIYYVYYGDIVSNKSNLLFSFVIAPILIASVIGAIISYFFSIDLKYRLVSFKVNQLTYFCMACFYIVLVFLILTFGH